jgi:hypothetical protein
MKTLERPALNRILEPVGRILTPQVARDLVDLRLDAKTQARLDKLARKSNRGKLTDAERSEYSTYVSAIDFVGILQAKARALLRRTPRPPQALPRRGRFAIPARAR